MLSKSKSINVTGSSVIKMDDGSEKTVMTFSGNINADGTYNVNKNVKNKDLYDKNKSECDSDYEEFDAYVASLTNIN